MHACVCVCVCVYQRVCALCVYGIPETERLLLLKSKRSPSFEATEVTPQHARDKAPKATKKKGHHLHILDDTVLDVWTTAKNTKLRFTLGVKDGQSVTKPLHTRLRTFSDLEMTLLYLTVAFVCCAWNAVSVVATGRLFGMSSNATLVS